MFDDDFLGVSPFVQVVALAVVGVALVAYGAVRIRTTGLGGTFWFAVGLVILAFLLLPGVS